MTMSTVTSMRSAVAACGLRARNWSGGGQEVFAIYTSTDCYLGTVEVTDGSLRMPAPWYKRDAAQFNALAQAFGSQS